MKLSKLYSEFFTNWLTDGFFINKDKISSVGIKPGFDRIFTKGYIRKIWVVEKIPVRYDVNLVETIREELSKACPTCKTYVNILNTPNPVQTTSDTFKRSMARAEDNYSNYEAVFNQLTGTEQAVGKQVRVSASKKIEIKKSKLLKLKDTFDSYAYVHDSVANGGTFFKTTIVIEGLCPNERDMRIYRKVVNDFLRTQGIEYREVRGNISKFLTDYGIASYIQNGSKQTGILFSEENLASVTPYRNRGLVGGEGILMGIDWRTKLPFLLNFFESGAGQIVMLLAVTGAGKTYIAYQTCLSLIADNVHCSVIDIKGKEWIKLKPFVKTLEISMGSTSSSFVNTMRLDDLNADKYNCKEYFKMALSGTINIYSIMTNLQPGEGNIIDLESVLEQAIMKMYSKLGVYDNRPETFIKTKDMRYQDIIPVLNELRVSKSYTDEQKKMCKLIISRCSNFVQNEGKYSEAFNNEITLAQVLDSPLVIYSFNKNDGEILDTMDNLRVFMSQFLDTKKQAIRKRKKLHTAAFYEELQRCSEFGRLVTHIGHTVTGSRSNNVIVFLLLNQMSVLDEKDFLAIRSNITTKIIGRINEQDINKLVDEYGCRDIEADLFTVAEDDDFKNCFVIKYNTGKHRDKTIFKVQLPDHMVSQFETRDKKI